MVSNEPSIDAGDAARNIEAVSVLAASLNVFGEWHAPRLPGQEATTETVQLGE